MMTLMFGVRCLQLVRGVRAVDSRCDWLQQLRRRRIERCEQLAEMTRCLQHQATLCVRQQHDMLGRALTRRGLRALRSCHDNKGIDTKAAACRT